MSEFYRFVTASRFFGSGTAILAFAVFVLLKFTERRIREGNRKGIAVAAFSFSFCLLTLLFFLGKREGSLPDLIREAIAVAGVSLFLKDVAPARKDPPDGGNPPSSPAREGSPDLPEGGGKAFLRPFRLLFPRSAGKKRRRMPERTRPFCETPERKRDDEKEE